MKKTTYKLLLLPCILFSIEMFPIGSQIKPPYTRTLQSNHIKKIVKKCANQSTIRQKFPPKIRPNFPPKIRPNYKSIFPAVDHLQMSKQYLDYEKNMALKKVFLEPFAKYFNKKTFLGVIQYINNGDKDESVHEFLIRQNNKKPSILKNNDTNLQALLNISDIDAIYLKTLAAYLRYTYTLELFHKKKIYTLFHQLLKKQREAYMFNFENRLEALKISVEEVVNHYTLKNNLL